jgi:hypothetical protein
MKSFLAAAKCIVVIVFIFATYRMILHVGTATNVFKYVAMLSVFIGLIITEIDRRLKFKGRKAKM